MGIEMHEGVAECELLTEPAASHVEKGRWGG